MQRPIADRDARVADLIEEYLGASRAGRPLDRDAFVAAHPDVADDLRAALVGLDFVGRAGDEISSVVAAAPSREEHVPATLGDFRLVREIGRGGMGVVYEAEQMSLARRVAVKVLPFASVLDARQLQRFKHEAQAAALLHHTNIVPVHAVGTERGVNYYAMEFVEGRTLAAVISELKTSRGRPGSADRARGRRPSPRAPEPASPPSSAEAQALTQSGSTETIGYCRAVARLGVQAAEALDHAHEHGVVHRDIKPANLMVDGGVHLWITDFGLAQSRANPALTMTGAIVGTLGYMSPEQALGKRVTIDHRTDIYSLGITLCELLTLEPAFGGHDPRQVIQDIAFKSAPSPRKANAAVPAALETILLKAVAKDPEARYQTAQEMADDLRRFLADEPVRARRQPLIDRVSLWARRHRTGVAAAACVLVVAVIALAVDAARGAAARRRIQEEADRAARSAERAEKSLADARQAVDRMLTQVASEELAGLPGTERVRRKLFEEAAALYDGMLATSGDDPVVRLDAARAFRGLAAAYRGLGDVDAAVRCGDRALELVMVLSPEEGTWSAASDELVAVEHVRAESCYATNRFRDAVGALERAVALAARGASERPDDPSARRQLALVLTSQSIALQRVGNFAEAEAAANRARDLAEALVTAAPADALARRRLGASLTQLGRIASAAHRSGDAVERFRRATEVLAAEADEASDSAGFRLRAEAHHFLADALMTLGRVDDALPHLQVAATAYARRASEFAHQPVNDETAREVEGVLAAALFRGGRAPEAQVALASVHARNERLLAQHGDRHLRARAGASLGLIADRLLKAGRFDEADRAFQRSAELLRELVRAEPGREELRIALSRTIQSWSAGLGWRMTTPTAVDLAREALANAAAAADAPGAAPNCRELLAQAYAVLADTLVRAENADMAAVDDAGRRAADIYRDLASGVGGERFSPGLAGALSRRADCRRASGRLDDADATLQEALSLLEPIAAREPVDLWILHRLSIVLVGCCRNQRAQRRLADAEASIDRAVKILEKLVGESPDDVTYAAGLVDARAELGRTHQAAGRHEHALVPLTKSADALREIRRRSPGVFAIQLAARCGELADSLVELGRRADAATLLEEAARLHAEADQRTPSRREREASLWCRYSRAVLLCGLGRLEDSARESDATAEIAERYVAGADGLDPVVIGQVFAMAAQMRRMTGRPAESISACSRALEVHPRNADALFGLAKVLADGEDPARRDPRRAVAILQEALRDAPISSKERWEFSEARVQLQLSFALCCHGDWSEAMTAAARARELKSEGDGEEWLYWALAHAKLGEFQNARAVYDRAVAWFKEHPPREERFARRRAEVQALLDAAERR